MPEIGSASDASLSQPIVAANKSKDPSLVPNVKPLSRKVTSDFSKPYVEKKLTLYSNQAQEAFEHRYSRVDMALYLATKAARDKKRVSDAKRAEAALRKIFDQFANEISGTSRTLRGVLEDKVPDGNRQILFDHVREHSVAVRTGFAMRFLNLTQLLDELVSFAEVLEINNVISTDERDRTIRSWLKRYHSFCEAIHVVKVKTMPAAQDKGADHS